MGILIMSGFRLLYEKENKKKRQSLKHIVFILKIIFFITFLLCFECIALPSLIAFVKDPTSRLCSLKKSADSFAISSRLLWKPALKKKKKICYVSFVKMQDIFLRRNNFLTKDFNLTNSRN